MSHSHGVLIYIISIIVIGMGLLKVDNAAAQSQKSIVHVEAMDYAFDVDAPDQLSSGWTTFVLSNQMANNIHEISLAQLPEGATHEEYLVDYMSAWDTVLQDYQEGVVDRSEISGRLKEMLPRWSGHIRNTSTLGLVSPGRTAQRTVYLEPGNFMMVCWLKTEDGEIHIMEGMHWEFTVTESSANSPEPNPESRVTLHENDIETDWQPETGLHEFELTFIRNPEGQQYHNNVHLIRMDDETDLDEVNEWMDWSNIGGMRSPSPAEFLGGLGFVSEADNGYFTLEIPEPGKYAWVVFIPQGKGLYKTFTVE